MSNQSVSIVMPAYNAASLIEKTVDSVLKQTFEQWELIIVDDGSTDATQEICTRIQSQEQRIIYTRIANQGVSNARNVGMKLAKNPYLMFLDADDLLEPDCLEVCCRTLEEEQTDIVVFEYNYLYETGLSQKVKYTEKRSLLEKEVQIAFLTEDVIGWEVWGKLYKRELLDQLQFPVGRKIGEDALFLFGALRKAKKVVLLPYYGYQYRQIVTSAMGQSYTNKNCDMLHTVDDIYGMSKDGLPAESHFFQSKYYIWFYRNAVMHKAESNIDLLEQEMQRIRGVLLGENRRTMKSSLSKKYYLEYLLITTSPTLYGCMLKLVDKKETKK